MHIQQIKLKAVTNEMVVNECSLSICPSSYWHCSDLLLPRVIFFYNILALVTVEVAYSNITSFHYLFSAVAGEMPAAKAAEKIVKSKHDVYAGTST